MFNQLNRCGSVPRSIGYTTSVTPRKFDYQKYNNYNLISNLTDKKGSMDPCALEYSGFRYIKCHNKPDSKRTLNPEFAPEPKFTRVNSCKNLAEKNDGNFRSLIAKTANEEKITDSRKGKNARVYSSFTFDETPISKADSCKRGYKEPEFVKYGMTTQIVNLPGGIKRNVKEIKDDEKSGIKKLNHSNYSKLIKDFKSNIECLPGKMVHGKDYEKNRVCSAKRFETNDIFNKNNNESKVQKKISMRIRNNLEPSLKVKKFVEQTKCRRPEGIKNAFESQINFSKF